MHTQAPSRPHAAAPQPADRAPLLAALAAALPADALLTQPEQLGPYECDGLSMYRQPPLAVALPYTAAQAQAVLRICHAHNTPVVPRGAGTGLAGGALPSADAVLLSLARLKRIVRIDALARVAVVEPEGPPPTTTTS